MITTIEKENLPRSNYSKHLEFNIYHAHMMVCRWSLKESMHIYTYAISMVITFQIKQAIMTSWIPWLGPVISNIASKIGTA